MDSSCEIAALLRSIGSPEGLTGSSLAETQVYSSLSGAAPGGIVADTGGSGSGSSLSSGFSH